MNSPLARSRTRLLRATLPVAGFMIFGTTIALSQLPEEPRPQKTFTPTADVSVGVFGQLTDTRTPVTTLFDSAVGNTIQQTSQGPSQSPGIFATFHQSFKPWLGYNVNFGYTRLSENYSSGSAFVPAPGSGPAPISSFAHGSIGASAYELTIAYLVNGPRSRRFSTFAQFGGGGLFFRPSESELPVSLEPVREQTRPAMLFGVGMDYRLTSHLGLRAEYRGLFYKSPDFTLPPYDGFNFPMSRLFTVTNEPAISLVYRFGGTKKSKPVDHSR